MATAVGTSQSCLFWGCQKYDNNIELCSVANIACVKWKATNIALGQYWFLLLLHGFIPSGPGQYGVLLPWLEEDMTKYIMSVQYGYSIVYTRNLSVWVSISYIDILIYLILANDHMFEVDFLCPFQDYLSTITVSVYLRMMSSVELLHTITKK